jgi:hypothetical protein
MRAASAASFNCSAALGLLLFTNMAMAPRAAYCWGDRVHACWQTSCWLVQLRVQGEVPAVLGANGLGVGAGPTTTHAF